MVSDGTIPRGTSSGSDDLPPPPAASVSGAATTGSLSTITDSSSQTPDFSSPHLSSAISLLQSLLSPPYNLSPPEINALLSQTLLLSSFPLPSQPPLSSFPLPSLLSPTPAIAAATHASAAALPSSSLTIAAAVAPPHSTTRGFSAAATPHLSLPYFLTNPNSQIPQHPSLITAANHHSNLSLLPNAAAHIPAAAAPSPPAAGDFSPHSLLPVSSSPNFPLPLSSISRLFSRKIKFPILSLQPHNIQFLLQILQILYLSNLIPIIFSCGNHNFPPFSQL